MPVLPEQRADLDDSIFTTLFACKKHKKKQRVDAKVADRWVEGTWWSSKIKKFAVVTASMKRLDVMLSPSRFPEENKNSPLEGSKDENGIVGAVFTSLSSIETFLLSSPLQKSVDVEETVAENEEL